MCRFSIVVVISTTFYQVVAGFRLTSLIPNCRRLQLSSSIDTTGPHGKSLTFIKEFGPWISAQKLDEIIPAEEFKEAVRELKSSDIGSKGEKAFFGYSTQLIEILKNEKRSIATILGPSSVANILKFVDGADIYDPVTVRAFLQTPAFEKMLGGIVYEGIFEFVLKVDILGNIVSGLPVIGPIRQTIVKELKKTLDKTLGEQVKTFLTSFNRIAVQRMVEFILSKDNRVMLSKANRNLVDSVLAKSLCDIIPSVESCDKIVKEAWTTFTNLDENQIFEFIDALYDKLGPTRISDFIDLNELLDSAPSLKRSVLRNLDAFFATEGGKRSVSALM